MRFVWLGVLSGLAAAFFSSLSYLISRHYGLQQDPRQTGSAALRLLVCSHVLMGSVCLPLAWALWPKEMEVPVLALWPLMSSMTFYLLGQACLFMALKQVNASLVSPLLGLKVLLLASIVSLFMEHSLDAQQWFAVCLSAVAAMTLRSSGSPVPAGPMALILLTCLSFSIADLCIVELIDALSIGWSISRVHAGAIAMAITYTLCGIVALPLLVVFGSWRRSNWLAATHYSGAWLLSMVSLYVCFALIGAVFGNVLQSTRGVVSVVLGALLAQTQWHELEQQVDRETLVRRLVAAILMTGAIATYAIDR